MTVTDPYPPLCHNSKHHAQIGGMGVGGGLSTITDQYSNLGSKQSQHKAETIFFTVLASIYILSVL